MGKRVFREEGKAGGDNSGRLSTGFKKGGRGPGGSLRYNTGVNYTKSLRLALIAARDCTFLVNRQSGSSPEKI